MEREKNVLTRLAECQPRPRPVSSEWLGREGTGYRVVGRGYRVERLWAWGWAEGEGKGVLMLSSDRRRGSLKQTERVVKIRGLWNKKKRKSVKQI